MLKKLLTSVTTLCIFLATEAQDSTKKSSLVFSGSIDGYYRFDFSGMPNNKTSFTNSVNSFELGMASLRVDHTVGKITATADVGFGRRAAEFSYNDVGSLALIKQMYVTIQATDKIKFTAGKFATHIGFELVDAVANRNYSMSYGFSYGPFFHTGVKADISLGGKTAFMLGVANPTDYTTTASPTKYAIAQLSTATKDDALKVYLNYQGARIPSFNLNHYDLVLMGAISKKVSLNYNSTIQFRKISGTTSNWTSNAFYLNYEATEKFGLTFRGEFLNDKDNLLGIGAGNIFIPTLSGNLRFGNFTIIPEIRIDNAKNEIFAKSDGTGTKTENQIIIAATYKF